MRCVQTQTTVNRLTAKQAAKPTCWTKAASSVAAPAAMSSSTFFVCVKSGTSSSGTWVRQGV